MISHDPTATTQDRIAIQREMEAAFKGYRVKPDTANYARLTSAVIAWQDFYYQYHGV